VPDPEAFLKLLTNQAPPLIGAWCLVGIIAASMSTAAGAILAMGTVFSHNVMRQLDCKWPNVVTSENLLMMARLSTIPFTLIASILAAYYKETGYLLIVAFDIVLATAVVPLLGCFYAKNPSPRAAFCSVLTGVVVRVTLEFTLPKDGFLILPFNHAEFYNYGSAASTRLPTFVDGAEGDVWDPATEQCSQLQFKDYTGVDSITAFLCSILVFVTVQYLEHRRDGTALFTLPGMMPYEKNTGLHEKEVTPLDTTHHIAEEGDTVPAGIGAAEVAEKSDSDISEE
jgi:Na+/proline symporter